MLRLERDCRVAQLAEKHMPRWTLSVVGSASTLRLRIAVVVNATQGAFDMRRHGNYSIPGRCMRVRMKDMRRRHAMVRETAHPRPLAHVPGYSKRWAMWSPLPLSACRAIARCGFVVACGRGGSRLCVCVYVCRSALGSSIFRHEKTKHVGRIRASCRRFPAAEPALDSPPDGALASVRRGRSTSIVGVLRPFFVRVRTPVPRAGSEACSSITCNEPLRVPSTCTCPC